VRTLVGGLGYRNLRDHSLGVAVTDLLAEREWPAGILVEDVSYNPIAVVQRLQDQPVDRALVVAAIERPGRAPGTIEAYRWDGALPDAERIQAAVAEAVTGVILLDNTLVVGRHFGGLPAEVLVVEVEPAVQEFGDELSPVVAAVFDRVCELVTRLATDPEAANRLPAASLGGSRRMTGKVP
jgi:hydrogenase maturation protease